MTRLARLVDLLAKITRFGDDVHELGDAGFGGGEAFGFAGVQLGGVGELGEEFVVEEGEAVEVFSLGRGGEAVAFETVDQEFEARGFVKGVRVGAEHHQEAEEGDGGFPGEGAGVLGGGGVDDGGAAEGAAVGEVGREEEVGETLEAEDVAAGKLCGAVDDGCGEAGAPGVVVEGVAADDTEVTVRWERFELYVRGGEEEVEVGGGAFEVREGGWGEGHSGASVPFG